MVEVINQNNVLNPSKGTEVFNEINKNVHGVEVKEKELESVDKDFRDFIKGNITMDELFKKREKNGSSSN